MRMAILLTSLVLVGAGITAACAWEPAEPQGQVAPQEKVAVPADAQTLVVAGGCFWCIEPLFEMVKGVLDVESGYAGGARANPSYEEVSTGVTGHAEAVKITFDPKKVSADDLLRLFFTIHDPTTLNRQGPDAGPQYRSAVFYSTPEEKVRAQKIIDEISKAKIWDKKIVTTLEPLRNYTTAEDYHQDYYKKFESATPAQRALMNESYCRIVLVPKVLKFKEKFKHLMKDN
jgi:peptide-methionine (S)-S-oxide reductase